MADESIANGLIAAIVGAVVGSIAGTVCTAIYEHRKEKRTRVLDLYNKFIIDPAFRRVNKNVSDARKEWVNGNRSMLEHFLKGLQGSEKILDNGLTPHINLSILLHFWAGVYIQNSQRMLDQRLLKALMANHYNWNKEFFADFRRQYLNQPPERRYAPDPVWVSAIPELESLFAP